MVSVNALLMRAPFFILVYVRKSLLTKIKAKAEEIDPCK